MGAGSQGPREYVWARVPIRICCAPGRGHWLLARRSTSSGEIAYYICFGPRRATLSNLAWSMLAAAWPAGTRAAVAPQTASANTTPSSKA
ncbi:IS4 family transposase [Streptomyces iranensis]|uniref:IS4 family transposase n=1 Tax=Streptomyces iranensis TaxID=576784 RepID=A0A060ZP69_9ACTN|nr:IS4 family transposase [Streptomyces iranensis]